MIDSTDPTSFDKKIATFILFSLYLFDCFFLIYSSKIAQNAVHCAMAGFTSVCLGLVNRNVVMIPAEEMLHEKYANQILPNDRTWQRLLASTGQPSFINDEFKYVRLEKEKEKVKKN